MLEDPYYTYDDTWKDYPTASTVEWLLYLKEKGALIGKKLYPASQFLEKHPPESLKDKISACIQAHAAVLSFWQQPESDWLEQQSDEIERAMFRELQDRFGLSVNDFIQKCRFWLLDPGGKPLMSGCFDTLFIDQDAQYGAIIQQYFNPLKPPHANKSKELEALATIVYSAWGLKVVYAMSVWAPKAQSTVAFYSAAQLQESYQRLCQDLSPFQKVEP